MRSILPVFLMVCFAGFSAAETKTSVRLDSILVHVDNYSKAVGMLRNEPEEILLNAIQINRNELNQCKLLNALCWQKFNSDPPQAMKYAIQQNELATRINNQDALLASYDNLAFLYQNKSEYEKSIEYMLKSLKAKEALHDTMGIAVATSGLAGIYYRMNNFSKALEYFNKSFVIAHEQKNTYTQAKLLGNIGLCYVGLGDVDKGLESYLLAVDLYKQLDLEKEAYITYSNIGLIYLNHIADYDKALTYFKLCLKFLDDNSNVSMLSSTHAKIAEVYSLKADLPNAVHHAKQGLEYAELSGDHQKILEANESFSKVYYNNRNYEQAYNYFKKAFHMKDTIYSRTSSEKIAEMQTKYDTEKKEAENKLLKAEKELDKAELKRKSSQQKMLVIGLILAILIVAYVAYSLIQKKKTNKLLNQQNEQISSKNKIIEEKNKDITDSINYAKRIQTAILPADTALSNHFTSFVFYRPKDIVSGDFYWVKEVGERLFFSVVDCTGHGVPGAFMSIIGFNSLNRIVDDLKIAETGKILDKLNELVIDSITRETREGITIRDGMDLSFCCFDKTSKTLYFSGAHNPLYVIRNSAIKLLGYEENMEADGKTLYEIKADKMAIGGSINDSNYTTHSIKVEEGDSIYLFSDGYADQFGGPKGKKFMYKRFKELLLTLQSSDMETQHQALESTILEWMGDLDQLDDICIIGIRL